MDKLVFRGLNHNPFIYNVMLVPIESSMREQNMLLNSRFNFFYVFFVGFNVAFCYESTWSGHGFWWSMMDKIKSSNKPTFLKGMQLVDGVVEVNVYADLAIKSNKGCLIFKVCFKKAYDSMS